MRCARRRTHTAPAAAAGRGRGRQRCRRRLDRCGGWQQSKRTGRAGQGGKRKVPKRCRATITSRPSAQGGQLCAPPPAAVVDRAARRTQPPSGPSGRSHRSPDATAALISSADARRANRTPAPTRSPVAALGSRSGNFPTRTGRNPTAPASNSTSGQNRPSDSVKTQA